MAMRAVIVALIAVLLALPAPVLAAEQGEILKKIDDLTKELERLKQQMTEMKKQETVKEERITKVEKQTEESGWPSWFELGGDFRTRYDYLRADVHDYMQFDPTLLTGPNTIAVRPVRDFKAKNESLLTNRFGMNLKVKATEDIQFKGRLLMYKVWGHQTADPVTGQFFADRAAGPFDGTVGHVPQDNALRVDRAYVTWSNIADQPIWFSVGRRPSTDGAPAHLRANTEKEGTAGVPCFLVNYAFDGLSLGVAPDIDALPGAYAKLCYGKGFDSGFKTPQNSVEDVNFVGINVVPYDTENLHVEVQWNRAMDIFNVPPDGFPQKFEFPAGSGQFVTLTQPVRDNLGDIDQFGTLVLGKIDNLGPGDLNLFAAGALSRTHPNGHTVSFPFAVDGAGNVQNASFGLLTDGNDTSSHTGGMIYLGARYDYKPWKTKIGAEFNYGTKNWITFAPAADDLWTSKLGTRGTVYEVYLIQELHKMPIAKKGKAFFRLGYQYYDFAYTGSNNWVGAPKKISDLDTQNPFNAQLLAPVDKAHDVYLTFDVQF